MRVAVVLAPWDPASPEAAAWSDSVAWLGLALSKAGFRVAVVGETGDVAGELARALAGVAQDDSVLLHVAGRLARRGVLRVGNGQWMPLRAIGEVLAAHAQTEVSVLAELLHEDDPSDALVAADHVASAVSALGVRERGSAMVAAVRPADGEGELPFTRLFLEVAAQSAREGAPFSLVYDRVRATPESMTVAQSFTLVRGRTEVELAEPAPPPPSLGAQIDAAAEAHDWAGVVALRRQRLASHTSSKERVKELVAIARVHQQELGDSEGAIAALEEARALEPRRSTVLQALKRGYEIVGRWASAIEVTGALVAVTPMPVDRAALRYAQARMMLDHLQDDESAVGMLEQALEEDPSHAEAHATLTRLQPSMTPPEPLPAVRKVDSIAAPAPAEDAIDELDPARYAASFAEQVAAGRLDGAFLDALALEELGALGPEHAAHVAQCRSVAPIRARGTIDVDGWELLRPYGMDELLTALFVAVARPAVLARVEQLEARGRLIPLDPTTRLDEESTASVVRGFQWASRVLGVKCPELYVLPDVPGEIAAVRAPEASTAVGPSIVSGRSAKDLAFLAGRHLTYYRPEHQVLVYFPTRDELSRLLKAAVALTKEDSDPVGDDARAVAALATRMGRHIDDREMGELRRVVWELEIRGGKFSVSAWTRNVELMAARAGLLLCGDLATAMAVVSTESRAIAGLPLDLKRRDLVAFCASEEHGLLRTRFASLGRESARPPAPGATPLYSP